MIPDDYPEGCLTGDMWMDSEFYLEFKLFDRIDMN